VKDINIPDPSWGGDLANIILDLEKFKTKRLGKRVSGTFLFKWKPILK
jgi:hypothetical protein